MKLEVFHHDGKSGWSANSFPTLDSDQTLILAFGTPELFDNPEPIQDLARAYPNSHIIGCSTAGEILDTNILDHSLVVSAVAFERTRLKCVNAGITESVHSHEAGRTLAQNLLAPDLQAVLVLSVGHCVNGSELIRGLNDILPSGVVVTGGLAGDADRFERTWVIKDAAPRSDAICAVGFYGDAIHVGHGSMGGWDIFGPERLVTRSEGNVLYELDGKPALQLYKEYLGERASELPASALLFPLALRENNRSENSLVRTVLSVDETNQSMTFAGDIPEGCLAQLMRANYDRLIDGAGEAALMTRNGNGRVVLTLSIAISCVGRRLVLGERTEEELEATLDVLPEQTRQVGFYSYGELSPYASGKCELHNQTMTLTTISEN